MRRAARDASPPAVRARDRAGGAQHRARSRAGRCRSGWRRRRSRRASSSSSASMPLARVGCYVPGGRFPLPSSLLMTAIPARVAGVREIIAVCPRPEPAVMAAALEAGVDAAVPDRRRARDRGAGLRHRDACRASTRSSARATATSPRRRRWSPRDCAIDFYAGPTEIVIVAGARPAGMDRRRSHRAGRARSRRARDLHHLEPRARRRAWRAAVAARSCRPTRSSRAVARARTARSSSRATRDEAMALANRIAPEHLVVDREALAQRPLTAGAVFVGPYTAQAAGDYATGSNHVLPTAGAARVPRRPERRRLRARDVGAAADARRASRGSAPTIVPLARAEGLDGARRVDRGPADDAMSQIPEAARARTTGCGCTRTRTPAAARRAVLEALARAARRIRSASIRRTPRRPTRSRSVSRRRPPIASRSSTGSTKASWRWRSRYLRADDRRAACSKRSSRSRRSRSSASTPRSPAARSCR